jgi:hypothetical protein
MTLPCAWDVIVPSELCSDWATRPQAIRDTALWLASTYLWAATGRQYGPCPVTVRPLQSQRAELAYRSFEVIPTSESGLGLAGGPFLFGGQWFNAGCATACCGANSCAVVLRGPVASVDEVIVGEEIVPSSAYRVDVTRGTYLLVRLDGECWPVCQNVTAEPGEPGSFEVTYYQGRAVPEALAIATALLACEYGKHLSGGSCALPKQMTRLSRQGVEVEIAPPEPDGTLTGIPMVDMVVSSLNPSKRKSPPMVLSPDLPESCDRQTVWIGGS